VRVKVRVAADIQDWDHVREVVAQQVVGDLNLTVNLCVQVQPLDGDALAIGAGSQKDSPEPAR
jgi:hypothetical protein